MFIFNADAPLLIEREFSSETQSLHILNVIEPLHMTIGSVRFRFYLSVFFKPERYLIGGTSQFLIKMKAFFSLR